MTYEVMISCVLEHTEQLSRMVQHMSLFQKFWRPAFSFIEKWLKRVGHAEERRKIGWSKYKVIPRVRNEEKERCSPKLREIRSENMREWKRNALAIHKEDKFVKFSWRFFNTIIIESLSVQREDLCYYFYGEIVFISLDLFVVYLIYCEFKFDINLRVVISIFRVDIFWSCLVVFPSTPKGFPYGVFCGCVSIYVAWI